MSLATSSYTYEKVSHDPHCQIHAHLGKSGGGGGAAGKKGGESLEEWPGKSELTKLINMYG